MEACWTERLKCTYCHLRSCTRKPVPKQPCPLDSLITQPYHEHRAQGSKKISKHCPAPSTNGLQRNANKAGLYQMVRDDLRRERIHLHDIVAGCSYPSTPTPRPTYSPTTMCRHCIDYCILLHAFLTTHIIISCVVLITARSIRSIYTYFDQCDVIIYK